MNFLKYDNLESFLADLANEGNLFVPMKKEDGATCFQPYKGQSEIYLKGRTDFSPKWLMLPEKETIAEFRKKGDDYEISSVIDTEKRIVFGIRPCDMHALLIIDEIQLKFFFPERNYESRRKNSITFGIQCTEACSKDSFCTSLGTHVPKGHDVLLVPLKEGFSVKAESEKGKELLGKKEIARHIEEREILEFVPNFESKNKVNAAEAVDLLKNNFESKVFRQEGERCLNCSSCTQVCPSCYCFLTRDEFEFAGENAKRQRVLDSCFLDRFSRVSHETVFRKSNGSKLRQFVCHNFYYTVEKHKMTKCTGCGRCIEVCPVKISITDVLKKIKAEEKK